MTAVAACATEGDATACLVVARVVPLRRGAGQMEEHIAKSWLARASSSDERCEGAKP